MRTAYADSRGRITIGSRLVNQYGQKFAIVEMPKEIVLIPVSKDPLASLRRIGEKAGLDRYTIKELKSIVRKEALKEAMNNVR